jgi:hypothetical protein
MKLLSSKQTGPKKKYESVFRKGIGDVGLSTSWDDIGHPYT